jgi:hypothetical protein
MKFVSHYYYGDHFSTPLEVTVSSSGVENRVI